MATNVNDEQLDTHDAPVLVAILIAAHRTGDRLLEQVARRELEKTHRIKLSFVRAKEVSDR